MSAEGMKEDAVHLFRRCGLYDLLCNLIVLFRRFDVENDSSELIISIYLVVSACSKPTHHWSQPRIA